MPQEPNDAPGGRAPSSEPTRSAPEAVESAATPVLEPEAQELQVPAKPRRRGMRAEIRFLETEPATVSLRKGPAGRVNVTQGDIFRDITFVEDVFEGQPGMIHVPEIVFPHVIVLTQACDLAHARSLLSVLVAPLYTAEHVFAGNHLSELGVAMDPIKRNKTAGQRILLNTDPRYHYLDFPDGVQVAESIIDFRHYFSVNVEYLRSIRRAQLAWTVPSLWREHISQRFGAFLARIGLPQPVPPPDAARVAAALRWPPKEV